MQSKYRYSLSLTSQFPFCSVPLRLDAYSKCQFACRYCFAAARGGNRPTGLQVASPERIERLLRVSAGGRGGVLGEMLRKQIPIHFGGMADPFPPMEDKLGVAFRLLEVLAQHQAPTIISTKGVPQRMRDYVDVISSGRMLVQFSFSVVDPKAVASIDAGTPALAERLSFMTALAESGVPVTVRLQPVFPGHEEFAQSIMAKAAKAGARHVAVEYLKYPVEANWRGIPRLVASGKGTLWELYKESGALLVGREWILPLAYRAERALQLKLEAKSLGLTFAYADNDMLHFSDGDVCCTGADLHLGVEGLGFNFHRAVKRAGNDGVISFSSIRSEWRPDGSVAQYMNSRTRARGKTLSDQIQNGWNDSSYAPGSFFGVSHNGRWDEAGYKIYELEAGLRERFGGL